MTRDDEEDRVFDSESHSRHMRRMRESPPYSIRCSPQESNGDAAMDSD